MKRSRATSLRSAFTLVEVLTVILIIAVLAAIIFPAIQGAIKKGHQTTSLSNLRQWYSAFTASVTSHDGEMPMPGNPFDKDNADTWYNRMPPEISETPFNKFDPNVQPAFGKKSIWVNPMVTRKEWSNAGFLFNYGYNDGLVEKRDTTGDRPLKLPSIQSPSVTILMGEKADAFPILNLANVKTYFHADDPVTDVNGLANLLFCDGHVETVKRSVFMDARATDPVYLDTKEAVVSWQPYGKSVSKE